MCSNLLLSHLEWVAQEYIWAVFGYQHEWRFYNFSGQPLSVLGDPCSKKIVFLIWFYDCMHCHVNVYQGCQYKGFFQFSLWENWQFSLPISRKSFFGSVVRIEVWCTALLAFFSLPSFMLNFQITVVWKIPQCKEAIYFWCSQFMWMALVCTVFFGIRLLRWIDLGHSTRQLLRKLIQLYVSLVTMSKSLYLIGIASTNCLFSEALAR